MADQWETPMNRLNFCAVILVAVASCAATQTAPLPQAQVERGQVDFMEHCASCHGPAGRGDGPVGEILAIPIPDLTRVAWENGGRFPEKYVRWAIDGRSDVIAHGPREMPVWGNEFRQQEGLGNLPALAPQEQDIKRRIEDLVVYLKSIQRFEEKG